jgi:formate C-acetyltransferase
MAASLLRLTNNAPSNLFEALQTSIIYYFLQHFFDGTCLRTMGRIDKLFYPYYVKEDKEEAEKMLFDYVKEIDRLDAPSNIPFALGGTDLDGNDMINELSYAWIATYKKADTTNTKLHLLCSEHTPADIIKTTFQYIREGNNSIVFLSDKRVIEALEKQGIERKDAVNYHVVGCYECGGEGELTCSCNARVNIPKALELALNGGRDMITEKQIGLENDGHFETFDALYKEFERQLSYLCKCAMTVTDLYESHYAEIHSAPILSSTYTSALQKGGDLYLDYSAKYNSSSLNAIGLATATDSLAAIRKAVFEDKTLTLGEFTEILRSDWRGQETFRLLIKNKYPKYGQGDSRTDELAKMTVDALSDAVSYKPNAKGGKWRLGLFSIDWRWGFGEKTAASADGRHRGETLSQNTSASFGADKEGATAHLISAARLDTSKTPNGAIVDIDLHCSAVCGENGINMLVATLKTYFELGGFAVQYNVLDANVLMNAKKNPENYPTLQVRLCGWNVLFSTLSEKEKDEFIARSMK